MACVDPGMRSNFHFRYWVMFIVFSLFLAACQPIQKPSAMQSISTANHSPITFLALGDSYTIGEGVQPRERWPNQLADQLRKEGIDIADPRIIATTGWTTDELTAGIQRANITDTYGIVTLLIGVNNQYRGRDIEEYRLEFRGLLQQAIHFAGENPQRVLVLSIPDWGVTPFAASRDATQISQEIAEFNAVNKAESESAGVAYVDITPISQQAKGDKSLLAADELHPSGKMYQQWIELAAPIVMDLLSRENSR